MASCLRTRGTAASRAGHTVADALNGFPLHICQARADEENGPADDGSPSPTQAEEWLLAGRGRNKRNAQRRIVSEDEDPAPRPGGRQSPGGPLGS